MEVTGTSQQRFEPYQLVIELILENSLKNFMFLKIMIPILWSCYGDKLS